MNILHLSYSRYANQFIIKNYENIRPRSRVRAWTQTDANEIKTFLGLLLLQSVCVKPSYEMYFSKRESIETPFFSKVMTERKFALICKFLHFSNNNEIDENTSQRKLFKIKPVLDHLQKRFMEVYIPEQNISIDESLLGWKGRLTWKQYIPSKRKRFGIKLFILAESSTGYTYNFLIYTGADTNYGDSFASEPLSARVVLELSNNILDKGYCLFLDNYYTSVDLAEKLSMRRTDCVGTMRLNRKGIPKKLKEKKLEHGEAYALFRKKIMLLKYKDKKEIVMISTLHDNQFVEKTKRGKVMKKPVVIEHYNKKMGGVDLTDNMLHFYAMSRTHLKKYYRKIFLHFLDITVLNSYILYKKLGGRKSRLNFVIDLAEKLIEKYGRDKNCKAGRRSKTKNASRLIEKHFPSVIPSTTHKKKPTKRCVVCRGKGKRKESIYWCESCKTGLCAAPCFGLYHS
ncbi:unnamed protein product [Acanthoscelides obtectus]|uniref:PiggyBac transposable element-derived protein 4-like n=2 Tax=Acanthoscelides obtectus TaxID=200917 RepID=A0A9P0QGY2_ACAOB|nr:unnamed protein product [Acanthoscelides obtectus]CAK1670396.1 PiggyBac transposable element-derived protein 4 [Acanthoscelides obtectus]